MFWKPRAVGPFCPPDVTLWAAYARGRAEQGLVRSTLSHAHVVCILPHLQDPPPHFPSSLHVKNLQELLVPSLHKCSLCILAHMQKNCTNKNNPFLFAWECSRGRNRQSRLGERRPQASHTCRLPAGHLPGAYPEDQVKVEGVRDLERSIWTRGFLC